jgi:hypothetical protein
MAALALAVLAALAPDNPRTEDRGVTLSLETLADLDERQQVGREPNT